MKSKILLFILLSAMGFSMKAQPLHWKESLYTASKTSTITKESVLKTEGNSSLKYVFTDDGTPYFICDTFLVTAGTTYNFSIDYLDNDPAGLISARLWFFAPGGTTYLNRYTTGNTVDSPNWQTLSLTGTTPATATKAYIAIRMNAAVPATFTSASFYADNCKYTEGTSTTNLIVNPGFEDWSPPVILPGSTLYNWKESLANPLKTSSIVNESTQKTEGFNSLKYTFTDSGTPYFLCDTFAVTAGSTYNFAIDYLDNDPAGLISARLWFFATGGTTYLDRVTTANTADSPTWQTQTLTGTTPATATKAYIAIRMNTPIAPASFTTATFYADNCKYFEGTGTTNLIKNPGFENWKAPSTAPEFLTFQFAGITPAVAGTIDKTAHKIALTVPYATDLTALVSTFTLTDGTTASIGTVSQVSATTPNNFTSPVTYTLTKGAATQDWIVTATKTAPATGKDIITFKFEGLTPVVAGVVSTSNKTVSLEVPAGTSLAALVPTITLSPNAIISPLSGVANSFAAPATYTVTAQDGTTQAWIVTVTVASAGQTTLFFEDFESSSKLKPTFTIINNDHFPMAAGEEAWADSCWLVSTTSRPEMAGSRVAMASSIVTMGLTDKVDRWLILPSIALGANSTISWQGLSTTTSGNYPDDYTVYIAPAGTGVPTVAYFEAAANVLLNVAPESWSAFVSRVGAGLGVHKINLKNKVTPDAPSGWFNRNVWIAFVLNTDRYTNPTTGIPNSTSGGSALAIDNIKVVNDVNTGVNDNKPNTFSAAVYPNPAANEVNVVFSLQNSGVADICIMDITGRERINLSKNVDAGPNVIHLNVSELPKGVYMVRTLVNNKTNLTKLVIH